MPRIVALDWDDQQVRLAIAQLQGRDLTLEALVSLPRDPTADEESPSATDIAPLIRRAVAEHRSRNADTIVAVRRAEVELRPLKLPPVPAEELPEMVRFQAMREFSELAEDWPIDFYTVEDGGSDETTVLAAAISPARLAELQRVVDESELKLRCLVLRPCSAVALVPHVPGQTETEVQLMVDDFGGAIELTVLRERTAVFMRTVQPPTTEGTSGPERVDYLAGEIRRTILAVRNQLGGHPVQQILLFGSGEDHQDLCDRLQKRLQLDVQAIDPLGSFRVSRGLQRQTPPDTGRFAAALGTLLEHAEQRRPAIDFLHPRRAAPPKSRRNLLVALGSAAGLIVLLAAVAFWWHLRSLDKTILSERTQLQKDAPDAKIADQWLAKAESVQQWQKGNINWLQQLREVSEKLPSSDQLRVEHWNALIQQTGDGVLVLEGLVDEQSTIAQIEQNLRSERRRVRGEGGTFESRDPKYPWRFRETITVTTADPRRPSNSTVSSRPSPPNLAAPRGAQR